MTLVDWLAAFTMTQDPDKSTGSIHGFADCHIGREYSCQYYGGKGVGRVFRLAVQENPLG